LYGKGVCIVFYVPVVQVVIIVYFHLFGVCCVRLYTLDLHGPQLRTAEPKILKILNLVFLDLLADVELTGSEFALDLEDQPKLQETGIVK
jgi:hypothetical protein